MTVRARIDAWLADRRWRPFDFQEDVWLAIAAGASGLLHASTGAGKTLAVWFGALQTWQWTLDFGINGGASLYAYPQYHRVPVAPAIYIRLLRSSEGATKRRT